ncbi:MAG: hypothetical protein AAB074_06820 [Planctomycetota bacterium]
MTPAFRRNGILAGLALSSLCALGFAQRSSNEWVLRWRAESEVREMRETELEAVQRERCLEMEAMQKRVALLESELAREREHRLAAEASATVAARPATELEASRAELDRAYARIGELERSDATVVKFGKDVTIMRRTLQRAAEDAEAETAALATAVTFQEAGEYEIVMAPEAGDRIRSAYIGTIVEITDSTVPLPQKFEGGLNQGVDFAEPAAPSGEPQSLGAGLNQGANYVDPEEASQVKRLGCKFTELKKLVEEVKEVQRTQENGAEVR